MKHIHKVVTITAIHFPNFAVIPNTDSVPIHHKRTISPPPEALVISVLPSVSSGRVAVRCLLDIPVTTLEGSNTLILGRKGEMRARDINLGVISIWNSRYTILIY